MPAPAAPLPPAPPSAPALASVADVYAACQSAIVTVTDVALAGGPSAAALAPRGNGSGWVWDADARLVVTAAHVLDASIGKAKGKGGGGAGAPGARAARVSVATAAGVVAIVDATTPDAPIPGADGLITDDPRVCLGVHVADCAPVFLIEPARRQPVVQRYIQIGVRIVEPERATGVAPRRLGQGTVDVRQRWIDETQGVARVGVSTALAQPRSLRNGQHPLPAPNADGGVLQAGRAVALHA
jgi:hypothetical protein